MKPALILLSISLAVSQVQALPPHSPAIWREVTGVQKVYSSPTLYTPVFTRPHVPALRTTADGRIGVIVEGGGTEGGSPRFALMMPEKMTVPFLLNPAGSHTMSSTNFKWLDGYANPGATGGQFSPTGVSHCCIWDETPPTVNVSGQDVYDMKLFCSSNPTDAQGKKRTQFFVTPIRILVSNPKTTSAVISSITKTGATVAGPLFMNFEGSSFEPMIVGDGRLLVIRIGTNSLAWTDPVTGVVKSPQGADIVYSYYPTGAQADPTQWTTLIPISHAPYDTRINTKFGFAMAPFRDPEGTLIPDGEDIGGSYPWMDREAKNLFMEPGNDQLHYLAGGTWNNSRYPQTGVPEEAPIYDAEDGGKHQNISFVGLWSHGKVVQIDNLINDMDYAVGAGDTPMGPQSRLVTLFQPNTGPLGTENGILRLGYGRSTKFMPLGENDNANIIDSLENRLNYRTQAFPQTMRDVVWPLSLGKHSDDIVFDDYVNPNAFIVANMTGLLSFNLATSLTSTYQNNYTHHSGWHTTNKVFSQPVKLQNAATPPSTRWNLPKHGLVTGTGRLEPAATGGIHGKGFWLDGTTGLEFAIPAQPQSVSSKDWYFGLFVDCRTTDDTTERQLLTFPDGSKIHLRGRNQILYYHSSGAVMNRITIPVVNNTAPVSAMDDLVPAKGWAHLAFQVKKAGTEVEFLLNGMLYNRWNDLYFSLFQLPVGNLTIGKPTGSPTTGFTGWIDDFKVFAQTMDPETACNHAGGTLIGLPSAYTGEWKTKFADRFPTWSHEETTKFLNANGEATFPRYANYYNYKADNQVHRGSIPAGTTSLRNAVHFPEGPLFHNAPRPHSAANQFCLQCHTGSGNGGLDIGAISLDAALTAANDPRRQPMQPPAKIYGRIPVGLVNSTGLPTVQTDLTALGKAIDEWMLGSFGNSTTIQSFTLVNADTKQDIMPITAGMTVDPAKVGTSNLTVRANLNSAQGNVSMQYNSGTAIVVAKPPYTAFWTVANAYQGSVLGVGNHTFTADPQFGPPVSITFAIAGSTTRVVADYRDDFKSHSPLPGWSYWWNAGGDIGNPANYQKLAWSPTVNRYSVNGFPVSPDNSNALFPYGGLTANGGHPGRGVNQAAVHDRYPIAAYTVKKAGYYGINNSFVTSGDPLSNGGRLIIYTDTNDGANYNTITNTTYAAGGTLTFNMNVGYLQVGDTIFVAVGPNLHDGSDSFTLDFSVVFKESGNPL